MDMPYIVKPDDTETPFFPANGNTFTVEELQTAVGGYFELLTPSPEVILVVNEDGKWKELPLNLKAMSLYTELRKAALFGAEEYLELVGDVLVCRQEMID